ncbi:hypothetical protein ACI2IP_05420 [Microbacterium sp. NPDC090218]
MTDQFSPERSAVIRAQLIDTAARVQPVRRRRLWGAALVLAGSLVGAGVSTAAFAATGTFTPVAPASSAGQPVADLSAAITAPPGTEPGAPVISLLGTPQSRVIEATTTLSLEDRPSEATHVRVTLTALGTGLISWGTAADGNNPSVSYAPQDIGSPRSETWYDFPLDDSTTHLYFDTQRGGSAAAVVQYVRHVPTHLAVNEHGDTYGVEGGPDGQPDLVRVGGVTDDGSAVEGYAWASELSAFSPEHEEQPSTPKEALEWQQERDEKYPTGWDIRIYENDGRTDIGSFHIG